MNRYLRAAESRYLAQMDEAKANLQTLFTETVGIGEHTDIMIEIDKWIRQLSDAKSFLENLHDEFDGNGCVFDEDSEIFLDEAE